MLELINSQRIEIERLRETQVLVSDPEWQSIFANALKFRMQELEKQIEQLKEELEQCRDRDPAADKFVIDSLNAEVGVLKIANRELRIELEQLRKARGEYVYPVCPNCLCVVETGDSKKTEPVAWMIECKELFTGWWSGGKLDCRFFDKDPNKGIRFPTKESAESVIRNIGSGCMIATGHLWLAHPAPEQVERRYADSATIAELCRKDGEIIKLRNQLTRQAALLKQCKEALSNYFDDGYTEVLHKLHEAIGEYELDNTL